MDRFHGQSPQSINQSINQLESVGSGRAADAAALSELEDRLGQRAAALEAAVEGAGHGSLRHALATLEEQRRHGSAFARQLRSDHNDLRQRVDREIFDVCAAPLKELVADTGLGSGKKSGTGGGKEEDGDEGEKEEEAATGGGGASHGGRASGGGGRQPLERGGSGGGSRILGVVRAAAEASRKETKAAVSAVLSRLEAVPGLVDGLEGRVLSLEQARRGEDGERVRRLEAT